MDFPTFVPGYITHSNHVSNGVVVQGGTNWDISRQALETPISPVAPQPPQQAARSATAPGTVSADPSIAQCYCTPIFLDGAYTPQDGLPASAPLSLTFDTNAIHLSTTQKARLLAHIPPDKGVIIATHASTAETNPGLLAKQRATQLGTFLRNHRVKVFFTENFGTKRPLPRAQSTTENQRVDVWVQVQPSK